MELTVFVELDTQKNDGLTISQWDSETGTTLLVVEDAAGATRIAFPVPQARAADAFRHPFRYAPSAR